MRTSRKDAPVASCEEGQVDHPAVCVCVGKAGGQRSAQGGCPQKNQIGRGKNDIR